jgi:hypothetical protein
MENQMFTEPIIQNAPNVVELRRQNDELLGLCRRYDEIAFVAGLDAERLVEIFASVIPQELHAIRGRVKSQAGRGHDDVVVAEALSKHREVLHQIVNHLVTTSILIREHDLRGAEALLRMEEMLYSISKEIVLWTAEMAAV